MNSLSIFLENTALLLTSINSLRLSVCAILLITLSLCLTPVAIEQVNSFESTALLSGSKVKVCNVALLLVLLVFHELKSSLNSHTFTIFLLILDALQSNSLTQVLLFSDFNVLFANFRNKFLNLLYAQSCYFSYSLSHFQCFQD